jgi:putative holliday junction resolvase
MRYLGIDYGEKRIGVAMSDERGDFAYPLSVLQNTPDLVAVILKICKENNIQEVVVGESRDFSQKENKIMEKIKVFVNDLEKVVQLPVHMHPEFLTSQEAERIQGKNEMHDASAAALILKSYLDMHNK